MKQLTRSELREKIMTIFYQNAADLFVQLADLGVIHKGDRDLARVAVLLIIERCFNRLAHKHFETVGQGKLVLMVVKINAQIHFSVHNKPHFVFIMTLLYIYFVL